MFGCCGRHKTCQLTGECILSDDLEDMNYQDCMLYQGIISYDFPLLYKLKQKKLVEIESNHITSVGIKTMQKFKDTPNDLFYILTVIAIMGYHTRNRLDPKSIKSTYKKLIDNLNN